MVIWWWFGWLLLEYDGGPLLFVLVGVSSSDLLFFASLLRFVPFASRSSRFARFVLFLSDDETADRRNLFSLPSGSRFQTEGIVGTEPSNQSTPSSTSSTVFGCARVYSLHVLELWVSSSRPSTNYFLTPHRSVSDRLLSLILPDARTTLVARYILDKPRPNPQSCRWNPA